MSSKSKNLHRARAIKNDEFYTQYDDIQNECANYMAHFFNKVIYCNCDTEDSNFVKYFLELKGLGLIRDVLWSGGLGGADFRSSESIEKLKQADIVISNPPFSLFREYIAQLIEYDKKFLIIGNKNAIIYQDIFTRIKENKIWLGVRPLGRDMLFDVPNPQDLIQNGKRGYNYAICKGQVKARVPAAWFSNLECEKRKFLVLSKTYTGNESDYQKYDNYDAINVNRTINIPKDYDGVMGVPISFLDKYTPDQFVILGRDKDLTTNKKGVSIAGKHLYTRIFIRKKLA